MIFKRADREEKKESENQKANNKNKLVVIDILRLIFAFGMLLCSLFLMYAICNYIIQMWGNATIKNKYELSNTSAPVYESLYEDVSLNTNETGDSEEETDSESSIEPITQEQALSIYLRQPMKSYDYAGLSAANSDFKFWLDIPNTRISYPVVQSHDNTEYLSRTFDGISRKSGSIFIDANIRNYSKAENLIVHGHNMKSGSMFGTLASYRNIDFYNLHPFVYLYTPDAVMVYQVFACYVVPESMDESLVYQTTFADGKEYLAFLESIAKRSEIHTGITLTESRSLLTLSTCTNHGESRFVVHALRYQ